MAPSTRVLDIRFPERYDLEIRVRGQENRVLRIQDNPIIEIHPDVFAIVSDDRRSYVTLRPASVSYIDVRARNATRSGVAGFCIALFSLVALGVTHQRRPGA